MTNSVAEGELDVSQPQALSDWSSFARQHDWRRAQAAASLAHLDPAVVGALSALSTLQDEVRGRRYSAAQRALVLYNDQLRFLEQHSADEAGFLQALAAPATLREGLSALEKAGIQSDAQRQAQELEAAQHPLISAEALNLQGVLHALQGDQTAARALFEQALSRDAGHYRARMNLGNLALESGQPAEAEAQYREVLKLAPDYEGLHHNLGVALRRQGKMHQSVSAIRKAQRLSVRRSQQETREDMQHRLRTDPKMRLTRNVFLALLAALFLLAYLLGRSHG